MRNILALSAICLLLAADNLLAETDDMTFGEGTTERYGICYNFKILTYYTSAGRKMKIFEQECGWDCWEMVYDGPFSVYAGPYADETGDGFPFIIGAGGHGYLTVPSGHGGFFAPSTEPTCDADFTPNYSTTFVISGALLNGIVLN